MNFSSYMFPMTTALALVLASTVAACSDDDDDVKPASATDAGTSETSTGSDSSVGEGGPGSDAATDGNPSDSGPTSAFVRVAHLSPDAPAVRVCVTASTATFSAADTPATPSLTFKQVTHYLEVPAGTYKARIVAGAATDCATSLAGLPDTTLPALAAGDYATAAAIGKVAEVGADAGATAFRVQPFFDLPAVPAMGNVHLRFVHAAPTTNIPVFVGAATGANLSAAVFSNVAYGTTDTALAATKGFKPLPVDATKITLGAAAAATGATVWATDAIKTTGLPDQSVRTAFAIDSAGATAAGDVDVLVCDDLSVGTGANASCAVLPPN